MKLTVSCVPGSDQLCKREGSSKRTHPDLGDRFGGREHESLTSHDDLQHVIER